MIILFRSSSATTSCIILAGVGTRICATFVTDRRPGYDDATCATRSDPLNRPVSATVTPTTCFLLAFSAALSSTKTESWENARKFAALAADSDPLIVVSYRCNNQLNDATSKIYVASIGVIDSTHRMHSLSTFNARAKFYVL